MVHGEVAISRYRGRDARRYGEPSASALVLAPEQPPGAHASQQLAQIPGVPPFAVQRASSRFSLQRVALASAMQHVTNPGLPQVECAAQPFTTLTQCLGSVPASTRRRAIPTAQVTYVLCLGPPV